MILRKINAALGILAAILFLHHAIFLSVWTLARCGFEESVSDTAFILVVLMAVHAISSILLAILTHRGAEKSKVNLYPKLNAPTYVQRFTGVLTAVLLILHIIGSKSHFQPPLLHAIAHPLFFALTLAHTAISTSKAFITLGIGNIKTVRVINAVIYTICAVTFLCATVGFYLCLFLGVQR